jgi:hypothetical protein
VKTHTTYLTFNTKKRQEIIDITDEVEKCRDAAGISEGMILVSAMHISASVFVNDHESGLERHSRLAGEANRAVVTRGLSSQLRHWRGQRGGAPQIPDCRS